MGIFYSYLKTIKTPQEETPQPETPQPETPQQETPSITKPKDFTNFDKNNDDIITWEEFENEFEKKYNRKMDRNDLWKFLAMDRDGDTSVTLNEWPEYNNAMSSD